MARPAAALVKVRWAMNEAILAFHWAHGELPRSQNRTVSRLRLVCKKHNILLTIFQGFEKAEREQVAGLVERLQQATAEYAGMTIG